MVEESCVRNISVRLVLDHLKKKGVTIEPLLSRCNLLMCEVCKEDGWLPFYHHARFFEAAAEALNDPFFALKLARQVDPREFGALAYVGITSKTLGDALLNLKRYMRAVTGAWNMDVVIRDKVIILEIMPDHPEFFDYQVATQWFVANLIHGYQFFIDREYAPLEIQFPTPLREHGWLETYEQLFACKVSFGHERCHIILERDALDFPVKNSDERLLKVLKSHCDQFLQEHDYVQAEFTAKIREKIIDLLPSGRAKAKFIAAELGLTERTMLRRLADENTSFTELREDLRRDLANKYIRDKRLSLKQIAYLLGYRDQSAFSVAFRRWHGGTPKEARNSENTG